MKAVNKVALAVLVMTQIMGSISFGQARMVEVNKKMKQEVAEVKTKESIKSLREAMDSAKTTAELKDVLETFKSIFKSDGKTTGKSVKELDELNEQGLQRILNFKSDNSADAITAKSLLLKIAEEFEVTKDLLAKSTDNVEKIALYQKQVLLMQQVGNVLSLPKTSIFAVKALNAEQQQGVRVYLKAMKVVVEKIADLDVEQARSYYKVFATANRIHANGKLNKDQSFVAAIKEIYKEDAAQKLKDLEDCI